MTFVPKFKTRLQAKKEAIDQIKLGRSDIQNTLYTRFNYLNIALGKGFSFRRIVLIAGPSGHGKSKLLNDLVNDFNNKALNGNLGVSRTNPEPVDIITIHFCFEMLPSDEIIREISSDLKLSFTNLLSIKWENGKYIKLSDQVFEDIANKYSTDDNPNYYYVEDSCTVKQLYMTIQAILIDYQNRNNLDKEFKDTNGKLKRFKVVVALDHTLLVNGEKNQTDINIMSDLGKLSIQLKKMGMLVILVGQFNGNIEDSKRISNPANHYPLKSDIYAQAQIYNACDVVGTIYCPELIGITSYTNNRYKTLDLINFSLLKNRGASIGQLWFKNALNDGIIESIHQSEIPINKV